MTTNQTIDGVSREQMISIPRSMLALALEINGLAAAAARFELRALLDSEKDEYIPDGILRAVEHGAQVDAIGVLKQAAQGEQVACMPIERCYDVRVKMIIAFNEAKKAGGYLDDALDAAYKSALRYSPNPMSAARPHHANPPPGTEPSGTHHDNDGLDEMRKP